MEAIDLMKGGLIDPITFFERMDYSNPQEMAKKLFIWKSNPVALFPDLMAQQQQQQMMEQQQAQQMAANSPLPEGVPINLPEGFNQPQAQPTPAMPMGNQ